MLVCSLNHGKRPKSWRVNGKIIHSYMLAKIQRHVGEGLWQVYMLAKIQRHVRERSGQDCMPANFSQRVTRKKTAGNQEEDSW